MGNTVTTTLTANRSPLQSQLDKAVGDFHAFGSKVKGVIAGVAAVFATKKLFDFGASMVEAADEAAAAEKKLETVLKSTGNATGFTSAQLKEMAAAMQRLTTFEDDTVVGAEAVIASFTNIRGDNFKRTLETAADMAAFFKEDLTSSAEGLARAINDPIRGMQLLARQGAVFTDSQQATIKAMVEAGDVAGAQAMMLDKLAERYKGQAAAAAETFGGQLKQLKNQLGDVGEQIGGALMPMLKDLIPVIKQAGEWVAEKVIPAFQQWASAVGEYLKPAFETAIDGCALLYTHFTYMRDVVTVAIEGLVLGVVKGFEEVKHWLVDAMPAYLKWFSENWKAMLEDVASFSTTMLKNSAEGWAASFDAIKALLTGEQDLSKLDSIVNRLEGVQKRGLTGGFQSKTAALPEIAPRQKGEFEKGMEKELSESVGKLSGEGAYLKRLQENVDAARKFFSFGGDQAKKAADGLPNITPDAAAMARPYEVSSPDSEGKEKKGKEAKAKDKEFTSSFVGLEDLNKKIQAAAASKPVEEKLDKVAKAIEETGDEQVKATVDSKSVLGKINEGIGKLIAKNDELKEALATAGTLA